MIEVQNLEKHYTVAEKEAGLLGSLKSFFVRQTKLVKAVDGVSFAISSGEMIGFLGANGAGKTTTLKMLSGLLFPSAGVARVDGYIPFERKSQFLKTITLVMGQKQQLMWDLPALDSFLVNQAIYEISDAEFKTTMQEFSELLGLGDILKKQVRKLSLGERMKCELAAALLHKPKVLFLDEPTIGLDVNMQVKIREFIAEYNQRFNATVILTSHYMADVTALCKRIVVVDKGKIIFDGDFAALLETASPNKIIKLQLERPVPDLASYGTVSFSEGLHAHISIARNEVSSRAAQMLSNLPIADITIEDPPIEDVIGQLFKGQQTPVAEGTLTPVAAGTLTPVAAGTPTPASVGKP